MVAGIGAGAALLAWLFWRKGRQQAAQIVQAAPQTKPPVNIIEQQAQDGLMWQPLPVPGFVINIETPPALTIDAVFNYPITIYQTDVNYVFPGIPPVPLIENDVTNNLSFPIDKYVNGFGPGVNTTPGMPYCGCNDSEITTMDDLVTAETSAFNNILAAIQALGMVQPATSINVNLTQEQPGTLIGEATPPAYILGALKQFAAFNG